MRMKNLSSFLIATTILAMTACQNTQAPNEQTTAPLAADGTLKLSQGFKAYVFVDSLGAGARHIALRSNGDLYVQMSKLHEGKGLAALRDNNGDGKADQVEYFGNHPGTGMAIKGNYLYCSSDEAVFRYEWKDGQLAPGEDAKVLLVGGFPKQNEHAAKSLTLDNAGHIYVNVGAPSNACQLNNRSEGSPGQDPCPQLEFQAGIWQFDAGKTAQQQAKDGKRYAFGIRNSVALEWNDDANSLFALQHGRDQLSQFWGKLFTDEQNAELPAEEFLQIDEGDFFGWPYCYFDQLQGKKVLAPEYGGDGKKQVRCETVKPPIVAFPGHMGPNDLVFYNGSQFPEKYRNGAFIAFHGSWNRSPLMQKGYNVVFVPFKDGKPSGEWEVFAEGFAGIDPIPSPGDAKHRPTGLATGADGALYVADSREGKIWKIVYQP
jgi:glucose/arabinose dehydrogenase